MEELKSAIKRKIKHVLINRQQKRYNRLLEEKTISYDTWIKRTEQKLEERERTGVSGSVISVKAVSYDVCREYLTGNALAAEEAEAVVFADSCGRLSDLAKELIGEFFARHPEVSLLYGDEDVMSPEGERYTPWLKPDWSPDTFLSCFYFGSVFAVRTKALQRLTAEQKKWIFAEGSDVYRLCYLLAGESGGFEKRRQGKAEGKFSDTAGFLFPVGHVDEILFHASYNRESEIYQWKLKPEEESADRGNKKISVIIPSKDNINVLKQCMTSLEKTRKTDSRIACEVIVVDNGSRDEVKCELEKLFAETDVTYLYQRMPFHFSKMCNLGAKAAGGDVLLFLNDDVEAAQEMKEAGEDFLQIMYETALRPYTGAVGVKLYYPDSQRIQHAGIVNLALGPVHKLQFKQDTESFYYGWNRKMRNVIAVTGACLAVAKERFWEAGGFPEELPVAFNDVDLCFTLFEKGYYSVVLQDVVLYHHESLSRGDDDSREKLERLLAEKDKLYERHPGLCSTDPFYHKYFAADRLSAGFELKSEDEDERRTDGEWKSSGASEAGRLLEKAREDACVMVSLEYAGKAGIPGRYLIQGYSFVTGSDNARYEKRILLKRERNGEGAEENDAGIWSVKPMIYPRKDVEENLPDQLHVGLTGFRIYLKEGDLPAASYRIGVLVRDCCSGGRLYSWTNRYLTMKA